MVENGIDLGVTAGGLAESGDSYADTHQFYVDRVAGLLGRTVPWFVAWGNHDAGPSAVIRKFTDLPSKDVPGYGPGHGSYAFNYAGCHFICLDYASACQDVSNWLETDLRSDANQSARFTRVFGANRVNVAEALRGQSVYAESDQRSGAQRQYLTTPDLDLSGVTKVVLMFRSNSMQNQDSLGALECSIDGGSSWKPVLYLLDHTVPQANGESNERSAGRQPQRAGHWSLATDHWLLVIGHCPPLPVLTRFPPDL